MPDCKQSELALDQHARAALTQKTTIRRRVPPTGGYQVSRGIRGVSSASPRFQSRYDQGAASGPS